MAGRAFACGALLAAVLAGGCAPPDGDAAGAASQRVLYVANALDGTVTRLDARDGRALGPPLPTDRAPARLAAGPRGHLLVAGAGPAAQLTLHTATAVGWRARPVPLEAGARPTEVRALAGDGGRYAVVAYAAAAGTAAGERAAEGPCRLALIDLLAGAVVRAHQPCARGDTVAGLALRAGDAGPVAYLATRRPGSGPDDRGRGRVVALDATTGAPLAAYEACGLPVDLVLAPAPPGPPAAAGRLYAVVGSPASPPGAAADGDQEFDTAEGWWLVGLDPEGLAVESDRAVAGPLRSLAVAPDGRQAYAFAPVGDPVLGSALVAVDLATGATADLGKRVPGQGLAGLAVTDERVYVPLPDGAEVWVGDRQGRPLGVVPVGRRPFAITLGRRRHGSSRSCALAPVVKTVELGPSSDRHPRGDRS